MVNEWFNVVKCWKPNLFNVDKLREVAERIGWGFSHELVEREMLYYDTMYAFLNYFPLKVVFGGGSLVNRVYIVEAPRFSFDLDTATLNPVKTKLSLIDSLIELNTRLGEDGFIQILEVDDRELRLGEVVVDVEKDVFPDMLSLKRIMPSMTFGTPLPTYLKTRLNVDTGSRSISNWIVGLKDELGFLPSIEEVRIEVGFSREGFKGLHGEVTVRSLLEPVQLPERRLRCDASTIEYSIYLKLTSLSKPFSREILPDLIRDVCDLRMLEQKFDGKVLERLLKQGGVDLGEALKTIEVLEKEGAELFEKSWHFTLIKERYSWLEICETAKRSLRQLYSRRKL